MNANHPAAGFSLIEVLCAILVLGVGIVGLTQGLTTAISSSREGEIQTTAALLAAGQVEALRADGYLVEGLDEGDGEGPLRSYHWQQSIRQTELEGLHEVRVVVTHGKSSRPVYELQTLLFDPPLLTNEPDGSDRSRDKDRLRRERRRP